MSEKDQLRFAGSDYEPGLDDKRLMSQLQRIFSLMRDGAWRTLQEISETTGDPPASVSAQLRHLRKPRFGSHTVNKQVRGPREKGLYEYQLIVNAEEKPAVLEDTEIIFAPGRAILKKNWVPRATWKRIDERLSRLGYKYEGKGSWSKG